MSLGVRAQGLGPTHGRNSSCDNDLLRVAFTCHTTPSAPRSLFYISRLNIQPARRPCQRFEALLSRTTTHDSGPIWFADSFIRRDLHPRDLPVCAGATVRLKYSCASCPKTQTNSRLARRAVSIVIDLWRAPVLGRVGGDVGDSGSPYAQGKHRPATGCHAPGRRPGSRPGPHMDQNVLAPGYAAVALALILDPSGGLFSDAARPCQRPAPPLWRKRGTRKPS